MAFYFSSIPKVNFDIKKNGKVTEVTNIFTRYIIQEYFKNTSAVYYNYTVKDSDRPDIIAYKYYGDPTLDWIILVTNNIVDPQFDWPLNEKNLDRYIEKKYGSISTAKSTVKRYERIVSEKSVQFDGTIVPERIYAIDQTTYNTLTPTSRRIVYAYDYEVEENNKKREIKILDSEYVNKVTNEVEALFRLS